MRFSGLVSTFLGLRPGPWGTQTPILPSYPPSSLSFEHIPCSPVSWTILATYWHHIQGCWSEFVRRPRSWEGCGHLSEASFWTPEITGRCLIGRGDGQGYCHYSVGPWVSRFGALQFLGLYLGPWVAEAWGTIGYVPKGSQSPTNKTQSLQTAGDTLSPTGPELFS